jgi:gluconolactonase
LLSSRSIWCIESCGTEDQPERFRIPDPPSPDDSIRAFHACGTGIGLPKRNDASREAKERVATSGGTASTAGREEMTRLLIATAASVLAGSFAFAQSTASNQSVVRLDPALDAVVSPDAKVELVKDGFGFTEGPVWVQKGKDGYLLFTDIPGNVVWKLTPDGKASVYLENVGYNGPERWRWGPILNNGKDRNDPKFEEFVMMGADGLTVDREGRLILATFAGRSLLRIEHNGKRTVLADKWEGKRFGGPNDVVVKRDGAIYFTDTYGALRLRDKDPRKELDFNAVFRWKDGKLTLVAKDMPNTNGLAFSPDEKYLYVNGSRDNYVNRYEVQPDGSLANGKLFIDMRKETEPGITDGLRVDTKGNLYETGPGGTWIISPEGKHLGTIRAPEISTNVGFGDADRKTLYIAARSGIYKIRVNIPGI